MHTDQKRVIVRNDQNDHGHLDFLPVFMDTDVNDARNWYASQNQEPPAWLSVVETLPTEQQGGFFGWWRPGRFRKNVCTTLVSETLALDDKGLGWEQMRELLLHRKELLQWIKHGPIDNFWRERRKEAISQQRAIPSPFDDTSILHNIVSKGIRIEPENIEDMLQVRCWVIYSGEFDSFLTPQEDMGALNQAAIFANPEDAERVILRKKLYNVQVAPIGMRVEYFPKPDIIGPRAEQAQALRNAQELDKNTENPTPGRSPRTRL